MNTTSIQDRLAEAAQYHQAGRLAEADRIYRGILQDAPRNADALHLLGVLSLQLDRLGEAIDLIGRALAIHGPHHEFHNNLAAAYLRAGKLIEAEAHTRASLRVRPDFADAHNNLGIALRGQDRFDEAAAEFREAIRLRPEYADALCNLGGVLHHLGNPVEAHKYLQEALRLAPRHPHALTNMGSVLLVLGQVEDAARYLADAIRIMPSFTTAYSNLGVALERLNRVDDAMHIFREALRLDPNYNAARLNLGSALQNQGKLAEALVEFQAVLRSEPNNVMALFNLAKMAAVGFYRFSVEEIQKMRALAAQESQSSDNRCRLHFGLAQALDKKGACDEAFEHCRAANELRKELLRNRGIVFEAPPLRRHVDDLIATFMPDNFERVRGFGVDSELPIFIVGMPRSGTSLAEQILASHPEVYGAGELPEMDKLATGLPQRLGVPTDPYLACIKRLDAPLAKTLAEEHLRRLRELGGKAARVIDKAPFNYHHLGLIAALFPRARIIHCERSAADTCLSCYFQNFGEPYPFTLDLVHLARYYREYQRVMAHWAKVLPMPIFHLRYEELTRDQEATSRRLVSFCGLEWDDACLRYYENSRVVRTFSALQVRQPMYRSSVDRWKRYEKHLQPLLEELNRFLV